MTNHTKQAREILQRHAQSDLSCVTHMCWRSALNAVAEALTTPNHLVVALQECRRWFAENACQPDMIAMIDEVLAVGDEPTEAMLQAAREVADGVDDSAFVRIWRAMRKAETKGVG